MRLQRQQSEDEVLITRTVEMRPSTLDEDARTVEAVLATENPVLVKDRNDGRVYREKLVVNGIRFTDRLHMLVNHTCRGLDDIIGHVDEIRVEKDQLIGRLNFMRDDPIADIAFAKVKSGDITDVSLGYRVQRPIVIEPHMKRNVLGTEYVADKWPFRLAPSSRGREVSLVGEGADWDTKIRSAEDTEFTTTEDTDITSPKPETTQATADATTLEQETTTVAETTTTEAATTDADMQRARDEALKEGQKQEAQRRKDIEEAGDGIDQDVVRGAIDDGMTLDQARAHFLDHIRGSRSKPVRSEAPGQISRSHEADCTVDALSAAMMTRCGLDPLFVTRCNLQGNNLKFRSDRRVTEDMKRAAERTAELGDRYATMSLIDVCREGLRIAGIDVPHDREELIERAVSTPAVSTIFTNTVGARLLANYETTEDTTRAWTSEEDVPNFKTNERHTFGSDAKLKRLARGATADMASAEDAMEEYKIHRFARRGALDDQDIIDDNLNALMEMMSEFGEAARHLRPDLVYSILHANAALQADNTLLFHVDHNNTVGTAALAQATLQAAITRLATQQQYGRNLNLPPAYIVVPRALEFTAQQLLNSVELRGNAADNGTRNPLFGRNITPIADSRLDNGVEDPSDGTFYAGDATTWYLVTKSGRYTIVVGYLSGTGRAPMVRTGRFSDGDGAYGIKWDIKLDIGAKALDYRGFQRNVA